MGDAEPMLWALRPFLFLATGNQEIEKVLPRQQTLSELIQPVVEALGCELWGVDCRRYGRQLLVRVYIDKADGINIEDCATVSRQISSLLDVENPISGQYTLEVSSPGMDRPLYEPTHYKRYIGSLVTVKLSHPLDGRKKFNGRLVAADARDIVVQVADEEFTLPLQWIDKARLDPEF